MRTIVLILIAALFMCACTNDGWKTTDKVEVISEIKSPDGKHVATVFTCSGGGAAGYTYTNVNLRRATDDFNQRSFLLGKHQWNSFADIEVRWKDPKNLEVSYRWLGDNPEHKRMNSQTVPEKSGVRVSYVLKGDKGGAAARMTMDSIASICHCREVMTRGRQWIIGSPTIRKIGVF